MLFFNRGVPTYLHQAKTMKGTTGYVTTEVEVKEFKCGRCKLIIQDNGKKIFNLKEGYGRICEECLDWLLKNRK